MVYRNRIVDEQLIRQLEYSGAILIEGAKGCGKTETARNVAKSEILLDIDITQRELLEAGVFTHLKSMKPPLLLDEWQLAPNVWNVVRREIDSRKKKGQFILTGSSSPSDEITRHTGARRFSRLRMRPMSLYETGNSTGAVTLSSLMEGQPIDEMIPGSDADLTQIANLICFGGWPSSLRTTLKNAIAENRAYVNELVHSEINELDGIKYSSDRVRLSLEAIARNISTAVSNQTLIEDMRNSVLSSDSPSEPTLIKYLRNLERLMILEPLPAWSVHLRSKVGLRQSPHQHFVDPSLATAVLLATPQTLLNDFSSFGLFFESLVVRDIRIYAESLGARVRFFGNYDDDEIDIIIDFGNKKWAAFEVKLNPLPRKLDETATNLKRILKKIDKERSGDPICVGIITGTGNAYRRDDGIHVIPITVLRP